jgi:hypothetical protein
LNYRVSFLLLLFAGTCARAQSIRPYLQTATPSSIIVNWKTDNGNTPTVAYGTAPNRLNYHANGHTENLEPKDSDYHDPYHYHEVRLSGLSPETGYYYRASSGTSDSSRIHYFRTPPARGRHEGVLRFIALGDHQVLEYEGQPYRKYDELVAAAKAKAEALYGTPLADRFHLILNDGDQVDLGKLDHYERIHFRKSSPLTHELPLITAVGNHEHYGDSYAGGPLEAYYDHFVLDEGLTYRGIASGNERYYAYQLANVLFVVLDTEDEGPEQLDWLERIVAATEADEALGWVISIGHRPYQAEQYADDYSAWYAERALPLLTKSDKFVLHMAGHHHLYARGQFTDHAGYHIISGGTAWPQYWGDSELETDRPETQGSWSNFAYQLVEIDNESQELWVRSYTIGSLDSSKDNTLLDEFRYRRNMPVPDRPTLRLADGTLYGSPYRHPAALPLNTSQFQLAGEADFTNPLTDTLRHRENWFGPAGRRDETKDIGEGYGILRLELPPAGAPLYARVRYRDNNLGWSEWSPVVKIVGGEIRKTEEQR